MGTRGGGDRQGRGSGRGREGRARTIPGEKKKKRGCEALIGFSGGRGAFSRL